jgi:PadR family transcriptional regulator
MLKSGPRMTLSTQLVLRAMLRDSTRQRSGLDIAAEAGLPSGAIHPVLARLEKVGWLVSEWEDLDPEERGRPRRRHYRIDPDSTATILSALARVQPAEVGAHRLLPGFAGGAR